MAAQDPLTNRDAAEVLEAIAQRLCALTTDQPVSERIGSELSTIRDQLRRLGESNADVRRWVQTRLDAPPDDAA